MRILRSHCLQYLFFYLTVHWLHCNFVIRADPHLQFAIRWLQKPNDIFIILKLCVTNHIPNYSVQLEKQIYYNVGNG